MLCVNCSRVAVWVFKTSGVKPRPYCDGHLPLAYRGTSSVKPAPAPEPPAAPEVPPAQ